MKISVDWIKDYVEMPADTGGLVNVLTMAGIEVEGVREISVPDKVVVCEIIDSVPHPNADKLSVCQVSTGQETIQVVCGAPNARAGLKTALAPVGTVFKYKESGSEKQLVIEERPLRGVNSKGMLCSGKELGISDDSGKIIELPSKFKTGALLKDCIGSDIIFDLEITPNRPDLYSHFGIAREIAAIFGKKTKLPKIKIEEVTESADFAEKIRIDDYELCPLYTARIIRNVKVKPSPEWLKKRLERIGLRPINNVVDITNFVLHELGQPLHAFDMNLLAGSKIIVRRACEGEQMLMLDGSTAKLRSSQLVIADAEKPVAIAGVMGGEHSGVNERTTDILLESAYFKSSSVRKTSRELGISTDSSYRFERGVDPEMLETASNRATALILKLAGGEIASPLIGIGQKPAPPDAVHCRFEKIRALLGIGIPDKEIVSIFKRLGLSVEKARGFCKVQPPSYRGDLKNEADLAEEVARVHGISNIPTPNIRAQSGGSIRNDSYFKTEETREQLISLGLDECVNYSLTNEEGALLDMDFKKSDLIEIGNPINKDFAFMRPSLLQGMIQVVSHNVSRKNTDLSLFELGRAYCGNEEKYPEERLECCIAISGRKHPERFSAEKAICYDFADIKGIVESWLDMRKIGGVSFRMAENANFAVQACAEVLIDGRKCGILGKTAERLSNDLKLKNDLFIAKLDATAIIRATPEKIVFKQLKLFPPVTRDLAFIAETGFEHQKFIDFIAELKISKLERIELFDEFKDKNFGEGKKSLAYSLTYRDSERTLTDNEVNAIHDELRMKLKEVLRIELR